MQGIWEQVKTIIKEEISPSGFQLWIEPLGVVPGGEGELLLTCPNSFALRWVQSHYLQFIRQALSQVCGLGLPVQLSLPSGDLGAAGHPSYDARVRQAELPLPSEKRRGGSFNGSFTFEQFVVGASNRLAFQASKALARNDTFYNHILFLTAGPGLGKSHLSQAVGNFLSQSAPNGQVHYLSAENFANEMVRALRNGRMSQFKERFRKDCEVLLLEEVQFLSGKEKIQAEMCYTLDTLMSRKTKLVFTSCYLPGEISQLSQELRSRLTAGVITPIGPPDFPTRVKILAKKAENRGAQVSPKILEYLAEYVTEDVRRLESAIDGLMARSTLLQQPFSLRLADEVLQDLQAVETRLSVPDIQKIVGDHYRVSLPEMLGRSRQKRLVQARRLALYFCRVYTQKTMVELGKLFKRSHASVVHALQTLERDRKTQPRLAQEVQLLEGKLAQAQVKGGWKRASTLRTDA
ncbi:MAG: chromosomal replication initiator protein DnaA [Deltaproteobacteria bacterium]|nr:chromosomal replication initiator protein DnaA [Deltaproteobacteria bacterium]MBI4796502.1 chromosomal replication initiator protein DnaA [Deltaproteobacteria bacterium]